jgi:glycine/D-amino acid oxidase-like deaminating enzyme
MHVIPTLIIGGGIAGAALGHALAQRGAGGQVTIVDVDHFGPYGASSASAGAVHALFGHPLDIRLALAAIDRLKPIAAKIDFRQTGSLRLCDWPSGSLYQSWLPELRRQGLSIDELSPEQLRQQFPMLAPTPQTAGALLVPIEGRLSPHKLRIELINHAQSGGVQLLDHWQVSAIERAGQSFRVTLKEVGPKSVKRSLAQGVGKAGELTVLAERIVNAAGPWAPRTAALCGRSLKLEILRRQRFLIRSPAAEQLKVPILLDGSLELDLAPALFDRRPVVAIGVSMGAADGQIDFSPVHYQNHVEPLVTSYLPALAGGEVVRAWVAYESRAADRRAVVGGATDLSGWYNFNGMTELSHCLALADAQAEFMLTGHWPDVWDLSQLTEARL